MNYTLEELTTRLDYLKKLKPEKYVTSFTPYFSQQLFSNLETLLRSYLIRDSEFELQVNKTLDKVVADSFHRGVLYEHQELIDCWKNPVNDDVPTGYNDILELFKGVEVIKEIMTVTDKDFKAAFYQIEIADSVIPQYSNTYLELWTRSFVNSVEKELAGLKTIMQYCANRSYNVEWAILFEDHGRNMTPHSVKYYAKDIFVKKNYAWLIETFNLNIYLPSYLAELR